MEKFTREPQIMAAIITVVGTIVGTLLVSLLLSFIEGRVGLGPVVAVIASLILLSIWVLLTLRWGLRLAGGAAAMMVVVGSVIFLLVRVAQLSEGVAPAPQATPVAAAPSPTVAVPPPAATRTATPLAATASPVVIAPTEMPAITSTTIPFGRLADEARAFAEPILAAIADRPPDFEDDFGGPGGGPGIYAENTPSGFREIGYVDGELFVVIDPSGESDEGFCAGYQNYTTIPQFSDLVLEIDGRFVSGIDDPNGWELRFREHPDRVGGHILAVIVGESPGVSLVRHEGTHVVGLINYGGPQVRGGTETNHIQIIARDSGIAVYANSEPILYVEDNDYSRLFQAGYVSLLICSTTGTLREARWDNLRIWDISDLPLP